MNDLKLLAVIQARVGVVQTLERLGNHVDRDGNGEPDARLRRRFLGQPQVASLDKLHRQVVAIPFLVEVEDLHDVRVVHLGDKTRLVDKHPHRLFVAGKLGQDALDDQVFGKALGTQRLGAPDFGHATDADTL